MTNPYPLGRNVNHDPRSRAYRVPVAGVDVRSVQHTRRIPVLDQGSLGSCTGNAAVGALGTDPLYATLPAGTALDEPAAVSVYSAATAIDDAPGTYPPDDTGSDGLSVAKVLRSRGLISGYQHAFSLDDTLGALMSGPVIVGVNWYDSMFDPGPWGLVRVEPGSELAGGHEFVLDQVDTASRLVGATNSWGSDWGVGGRFWLEYSTLNQLLAEQGDVVSFVPITAPAPTPTPDPDHALWDCAKAWAARRHYGPTKVVARQILAWGKAKGLS